MTAPPPAAPNAAPKPADLVEPIPFAEIYNGVAAWEADDAAA